MKTYLISRTDAIGDVVLTLPMAGAIKAADPTARIWWLGSAYAQAVVACSEHVDGFIDYTTLKDLPFEEQVRQLRTYDIVVCLHVFPVKAIARLVAAAHIPERVGATGRWYHWVYCNRRVWLSRRRSPLHEAQLNMRLLEKYIPDVAVSLTQLTAWYGFAPNAALPPTAEAALQTPLTKVILHPKSKGSAREWGLANFAHLINLLPPDRYRIFITGTAAEGAQLETLQLHRFPHVVDMTGKLSLSELITFISRCDALVAASTGPLHIAAAAGIRAVGLFAPIQPMHPGRWQPLGKRATYLVLPKNCEACRKSTQCACIQAIAPAQVWAAIEA